MKALLPALILATAALAMVPGPARAGQSNGLLAVGTSIFDMCATTSGNVALGNYTGASVAGTNASQAVYCTAGTVVNVALDQGQNAQSGSTCAVPLRRMKGPNGSFMAYTIYTNSRANTVWGCTTPNDVGGTGQGILVKANVPVPYVMANAGQDLPAGSYTDTVTMIVTY
jgi:spore coat protein U-like protein